MSVEHTVTKRESHGSNNYYSEAMSPVAPAIQQAPITPPHVYANPTPLGMLAYGTVFLCSSLLTLGTAGVTTPNLVLVFAMFYGGIFQTLVGMWEMFLGNTFGATVFSTYGGFNFTYGALYLPQMGLAQAYSAEEFTRAVGIFLAIWDFITFLFCIGSLRTAFPVTFTLGSTVCSLTCLSAAAFTGNARLNTAGGAMGLVATAGAYYGALSGFYSQESTFKIIRLPPIVTARSARSEV